MSITLTYLMPKAKTTHTVRLAYHIAAWHMLTCVLLSIFIATSTTIYVDLIIDDWKFSYSVFLLFTCVHTFKKERAVVLFHCLLHKWTLLHFQRLNTENGRWAQITWKNQVWFMQVWYYNHRYFNKWTSQYNISRRFRFSDCKAKLRWFFRCWNSQENWNTYAIWPKNQVSFHNLRYRVKSTFKLWMIQRQRQLRQFCAVLSIQRTVLTILRIRWNLYILLGDLWLYLS